jgi:hypothetical protein
MAGSNYQNSWMPIGSEYSTSSAYGNIGSFVHAMPSPQASGRAVPSPDVAGPDVGQMPLYELLGLLQRITDINCGKPSILSDYLASCHSGMPDTMPTTATRPLPPPIITTAATTATFPAAGIPGAPAAWGCSPSSFSSQAPFYAEVQPGPHAQAYTYLHPSAPSLQQQVLSLLAGGQALGSSAALALGTPQTGELLQQHELQLVRQLRLQQAYKDYLEDRVGQELAASVGAAGAGVDPTGAYPLMELQVRTPAAAALADSELLRAGPGVGVASAGSGCNSG